MRAGLGEALRSGFLSAALVIVIVIPGCADGVLSPDPNDGPSTDAGPSDPFVPLPDAGPRRDAGTDGGNGGIDAGPQTCDALDCGPTGRCVPGPGGVGVRCEDISCADDLDCAFAEWCDGTICRADVCSPRSTRCSGETLEACAPSGGGYQTRYVCGGGAYFDSRCTVGEAGEASCPCEDDWDCPAHTTCEAGACTGTGREPTCLLEPRPFDEVLPSLENGFPWGEPASARKRRTAAPTPVPPRS